MGRARGADQQVAIIVRRQVIEEGWEPFCQPIHLDRLT